MYLVCMYISHLFTSSIYFFFIHTMEKNLYIPGTPYDIMILRMYALRIYHVYFNSSTDRCAVYGVGQISLCCTVMGSLSFRIW